MVSSNSITVFVCGVRGFSSPKFRDACRTEFLCRYHISQLVSEQILADKNNLSASVCMLRLPYRP